MTCREVVDFLMQYLDGELPAAQRMVFEGHLAECGCCRKFMDSYKRTVELAHDCPCKDPRGEKPPEELVRAILEARKAK